MALSKIRRLLIAVVGFLLLLNILALGVARFGSSQAVARDQRFEVVGWTEKADVAKAAKAELETAGRQVSLTETKRDTQVPNGYRLVMQGDADFLASVLETLKFQKLPVKLVSNGKELQLGEVYQDRAKAENKARAVLASQKVNFQVKESHKTVTKPAHKLVVSGLDEKAADEVLSVLRGKGLDAESQPVEEGTPAGEPG